MQLTPRYGNDPVLVLDGAPDAVLGPTVRQRRRLAATVSSFTDEQWTHPSRCEGWSNRDVISHLDSTNAFWSFSIRQGLAGEPTRFLATFDPVASPAQIVAGTAELPAEAVLESFLASNEAYLTLLESLDDDGWQALAEAPPGHVAVRTLATHGLWDAWVHERDILLPLGLDQALEPDEVTAALRFAASLGPTYGMTMGMPGRGTIGIDATDPTASFRVEVGDAVVVHDGDGPADLVLAGDAVELIEALSLRAPLASPVPAEHAWLLAGLATVFDVAP